MSMVQAETAAPSAQKKEEPADIVHRPFFFWTLFDTPFEHKMIAANFKCSVGTLWDIGKLILLILLEFSGHLINA
ncbi:hypothetical protein NST99_29835 [Paenibacillus sp. FSL L8-0470]|uniref:hypothetical protein n=1 Tax=unclassified Paenibacillus TaxID=185978 RepID=UPI0030FB9F04